CSSQWFLRGTASLLSDRPLGYDVVGFVGMGIILLRRASCGTEWTAPLRIARGSCIGEPPHARIDRTSARSKQIGIRSEPPTGQHAGDAIGWPIPMVRSVALDK